MAPRIDRLVRSASTLLLGLAIGCVLAACATPKKSLSAHAQLALRVDAAVKELEEQLNRRNHQRIVSLLAPPLTEDKAFAQGLTDLFDQAATLQAAFTIERLWVQNPDLPAGQAGTIRVDLHWTLHATLAAGPTTVAGSPRGLAQKARPEGLTTSGTARFTMVGKETPRLAAVTGDSPFRPQFDRPLIP